MAYTEYKYDKDRIDAIVEKQKESVRKRRPNEDPLVVALGVIKRRLERDSRSYRDYGPWWWSLKDAMNRNGYNLGQQSDPLIARAYRFDEDLHTIMAADTFRDAYLKRNIIYTNQFVLDADSPEFYTLFDEDMEFSI